MYKSFADIIDKAKSLKSSVLSVAVAQDEAVLKAVSEAKKLGICDAILVGDEAKIREIFAEMGEDADAFEIINEMEDAEAARIAVKLTRDGRANMYMKGILGTKDFLKSILDKEVGLRTGGILSHVCVFDLPSVDRLLFLTDCAFIVSPTLEEKVEIIKNTLPVCRAIGLEMPKVAPIAPTEVVNPKILSTVEAEMLTKMNEAGEIEGCIIDGPLALDLAISPEAARIKKTDERRIKGDADVLLFPDLDAGNAVYKTLIHAAPHENGNIITGTKVPVIVTSRSDSFETKVNSIALAAVVASQPQKG